ncbi:MAG: hypothetical protein KDA44_06550 [Planctomycetales bacterium]|nr:hypothetical protein [Planctomycetales bacterium]
MSTITAGALAAMPAYAPATSSPAPTAFAPAPSAPFATSHPVIAGTESVSPPVLSPPAPAATAPAAATTRTEVADGSRKSDAAGPRLLPPTAAPAITAPLAASPAPAILSVTTTQAVPNGLPSLDPPTPQEITAFLEQQQPAAADSAGVATSESGEIATTATPRTNASRQIEPTTTSRAAAQTELDEDLATLGTLTGEKIDLRAREMIAAGYDLARRGAYYAARLQFVGVLRMIAEAKDDRHGAVRRAAALAEGLQALDEAEDFLTIPADADANQEAAVLLRSHKTAVGREGDAAGLPPAQLADRYYRYAQRQLASAVAGEPAGSMALHALGKLTTEQHTAAETDFPLALRRAASYQQAALLARDDNYLAAHELGVLMAETGHYLESADLLRKVASEQPNPVVLRNLARVERSLGRSQAAQLAEQEAARLAVLTPDPRVAWMPPGQFAAQSGTGQSPNFAGSAPPMQTPYGTPQVARGPAAQPAGGLPPNMRFMR